MYKVKLNQLIQTNDKDNIDEIVDIDTNVIVISDMLKGLMLEN